MLLPDADDNMALGVILLLLACFLSGTLHVLWSRREVAPAAGGCAQTPPPRSRSRCTLQLGAVTCEVVEFEDFELIRTSEHVVYTPGW
jgi:hypothetical protein